MLLRLIRSKAFAKLAVVTLALGAPSVALAQQSPEFLTPTETSNSSPTAVIESPLQATVSGELENGDLVLPEGQFADGYDWEGRVGQRVRISLSSGQFDTLVALVSPGGETLVNDDFEGQTGHSVIETVLTEDGLYCIAVSSFAPNETGRYRLCIETISAPPTRPRRTPAMLGTNLLPRDHGEDSETAPPAPGRLATSGRILGVFVGIHPNGEDHMQFCDDDAVTVCDLFRTQFSMRSEDCVQLLNDDATVRNILGSLQRLAGSAGRDDMLVFFYSGHGSTQTGIADAQDPDGVHETLSVWDGSILDDELAEVLNTSTAGRCLVVLDSCMSGGFAKDVTAAPGRMGLFSSQEDVTSTVPFTVEASEDLSRFGGFLSAFFVQALSTHRDQADFDGNRQLTALELDNFIQVRFVQEIQAANAGLSHKGDYLSVGSDNLFLQRPVIDRSLRFDDVLFTW